MCIRDSIEQHCIFEVLPKLGVYVLAASIRCFEGLDEPFELLPSPEKREHAVQMVVPAEQALQLRVGQPVARRTCCSPVLGVASSGSLIDVLAVVEEDRLRLEHLGDRHVPVGSPSLLLHFGEVVREGSRALHFGNQLFELIFVGVQMLSLIHI